MNIYDFVALGKVSEESAKKLMASSGQDYIYKPTLPEFQYKQETGPVSQKPELTWQEKLGQGIPLTPDELVLMQEFGAKQYEKGKIILAVAKYNRGETLTAEELKYFALRGAEVYVKGKEVLGEPVPITFIEDIPESQVKEELLEEKKAEIEEEKAYSWIGEPISKSSQTIYDRINAGLITIEAAEILMASVGGLDYSKITIPYGEESEINNELINGGVVPEKEPVEENALAPIILAGALLLTRVL